MGREIGKLFASRIRALMAERPDLNTQAKIARLTGMSQTTVGRILNNKVSPSLEHVGLICDAFGVSLSIVMAQDFERKGVIKYDREGFARLPAAIKRQIESFIEFEIAKYAASKSTNEKLDPPELRSAARRSESSPLLDLDAKDPSKSKRKNVRRAADATAFALPTAMHL